MIAANVSMAMDYINVVDGSRASSALNCYYVFYPPPVYATVTLQEAPKKVPMHQPLSLSMRGRLLLRSRVKLYPQHRLPSRRNRNLNRQ